MSHKHVPAPATTRARCPVCSQTVYSRSGIHPQCAMKQSEPPRPKPAAPAPAEAAVAAQAPPFD